MLLVLFARISPSHSLIFTFWLRRFTLRSNSHPHTLSFSHFSLLTLSLLPIPFHNHAAGDIHHPVGKPDGVFEAVVLAVGIHRQAVHQIPDGAGHYVVVVGVLKEFVAFLFVVHNDGIQSIVRFAVVTFRAVTISKWVLPVCCIHLLL